MAIDVHIELDAQYRQLREAAGFVRRSARGVIATTGPDAAEYLQGQLTNDIEALAPGEGCYAALLDRKGHMQADMRVLRVDAGELLLEVEAVALPAALRHLNTYRVGRDVEVADRGEETAVVSVIGPASLEATTVAAPLAEHSHRSIELGGAEARAVGTAAGIDLICAREALTGVETALEGNGAAAAAEEAAEILRVEAGVPRYGAEMGPSTIPAEAGIVERAVSFTKGCYIGQETVARLHYKGRPNRSLRGLRLSAPAAAGDVLRLGDRDVGAIGTACISPALGPIALAIVRREASPGDELAVGERGAGAEVVDLPFG
jgi:folate-binding protein YgfZ